MKKIILFIAILVSISMQAQNMTDAIRIADTQVIGTARYVAMGGAFGAVGGDMTAIANNPASSAVFNNSFVTGTLGLSNKNIGTSYFTTKNSTDATTFNFGQIGAVFVGETADTDWSRFSFAINFNRENTLREDFLLKGRNTNASVIDYFKSIADDAYIPLNLVRAQTGETIDDLYQYLGENESFDAQQVFLAYNGYILNPLDATDDNNTTYTASDNYLSSDQEMYIFNKGFNDKLTINIGASHKNKTYIGASLHLLMYKFEQESKFTEKGVGAAYLKEIKFDNFLTTEGSGASFSLGVIHRITDAIRVGLTYDSPKFYAIEDELSQALETVRDDGTNLIRQTVDPIITNIYPEYHLTIPSKTTASLAIVLGKSGLISADYSYQNQANIKMRPKTDFVQVNQDISQHLKAVSEFRLGTEWRLGQLSVRGGYTLKQSPYKNTAIRGDFTSYSAGLGYRFDGVTIDVSYMTSSYNDAHQLYTTGLTNAALLSKENNQVLVTAKFEL
jgi:hypothetical protein